MAQGISAGRVMCRSCGTEVCGFDSSRVSGGRRPSMPDEGQRGSFKGLNGHHDQHDQIPANSVEDAPCGGVATMPCTSQRYYPEVEGVADGGLEEGQEGEEARRIEGGDMMRDE